MTDLHYREMPPSAPLAGYVRCYWTLQSSAAGAPWRILPDGCADLLFELADAVSARWVGTMTRALNVAPGPQADLFGIRFEPGGLHALTGKPLHPLTDATVDAEGEATVDLVALKDALAATPHFSARCRAADAALRGALPRAHASVLSPLLAWLERCEQLPRVEALARHVGLTSRTLERMFRVALGVGPKQHLRFVRFERARRLLERRTLRGAEIAAEASFVDEAHFIHEFRRFSGLTPGDYRREQAWPEGATRASLAEVTAAAVQQ